MGSDRSVWATGEDELVRIQLEVAEAAREALASSPWSASPDPLIGACFVTFEKGSTGPGQAGERAWAGAVTWRPSSTPVRSGVHYRRSDRALVGSVARGSPRRASDVEDQAVVEGHSPAPYVTGLLALREGPILASVVGALHSRPDVVMVDATGLDHPRRAGLAVHLGSVIGLPTVGVTHRTLVAGGNVPPLVRGETSPLTVDGELVGHWVCTRTGARPVAAHAAWRTAADTAAALVLLSSTDAARTPIPLQEARRVAREARAFSGPGMT